jgi:hypothetical protein
LLKQRGFSSISEHKPEVLDVDVTVSASQSVAEKRWIMKDGFLLTVEAFWLPKYGRIN